jgi:protein O-mannosyl-transferase
VGNATRTTVIISLLLALSTFAVYFTSLHNGTVNFDDPIYVTKNKHVQAGLTGESVRWAFSTNAEQESSNWHPLTWLSLMLDKHLYSSLPFGYHFTSLLLHILGSILLFLALSRMTGSVWKSSFVAALFALHPTHVESVAWIAERKDVLSGVFWMLTMLAYAWYVEKPGIVRYSLIVVSFGLGLMAKPMLVSLPIALLLLDYWPLERNRTQPWSKLLLEKLPLFALAGIVCAITMIAQKAGNAIAPASYIPMNARVANAVVAYARYIGKAIWPTNLSAYYPHLGRTIGPDVMSTVAGAGILMAAASLAAWFVGRKRRYLLMGWLWFVITLLPVIGIIQVGPQGMADRYTYLPFIGLFLIAVWGIPDLASQLIPEPEPVQTRKGRKSRREQAEPVAVPSPTLSAWSVAIPAVCVLLIFGHLTHVQADYWKDSITLFQHAAGTTGDNALTYYNIACEQLKDGEYGKAVANYEKARQMKPDVAKILNGCGSALNGLGRYNEAVSRYREALRLEPERPEIHANLGITLVNLNRIEEAIKEFHEAIRIKPDLVEAHTNLGVALTKIQPMRLDEAASEFHRALRLDPSVAEAHYNLMGIYLFQNDLAKARTEMRAYEQLGGQVDPQTKALVMDRPNPKSDGGIN